MRLNRTDWSLITLEVTHPFVMKVLTARHGHEGDAEMYRYDVDVRSEGELAGETDTRPQGGKPGYSVTAVMRNERFRGLSE